MGRKLLILVCAVLIALGIGYRVRGLLWGLPGETRCLRTYASDESEPVRFIANMNPARLDFDFDDPESPFPSALYSPGTIYGMAATVKAANLLGLLPLAGRSYYETHPDAADRLYIASRSFVLITGILTLWAVFLFGRALYTSEVGWVAAALLAINPVHMIYSFLIDNHVLMVLAATLSFFFASRVLRHGRTRDYALAGFCAGLAMCNALHGVLSFAFLLFVHLAATARGGWRAVLLDRRPWLAGLCLVVGVVVEYPYYPYHLATDWDKFTSIFSLVDATSHVDVSMPWFYLVEGFVATLGGPLYAVAIVAGLFALRRHRAADLVSLGFIALVLAFLCRQQWQYIRYMLMVFPPLYCLIGAAVFVSPPSRGWRIAAGVLLLVAVAYNFCYTTATFRAVLGPDPRLQASDYLSQHADRDTPIGTPPVGWFTPPVLQAIGGDTRLVLPINFDTGLLARSLPPFFVTSEHHTVRYMMPDDKWAYKHPFDEEVRRLYPQVIRFQGNYRFLGVPAGSTRYVEYRNLNPATLVYRR